MSRIAALFVVRPQFEEFRQITRLRWCGSVTSLFEIDLRTLNDTIRQIYLRQQQFHESFKFPQQLLANRRPKRRLSSWIDFLFNFSEKMISDSRIQYSNSGLVTCRWKFTRWKENKTKNLGNMHKLCVFRSFRQRLNLHVSDFVPIYSHNLFQTVDYFHSFFNACPVTPYGQRRGTKGFLLLTFGGGAFDGDKVHKAHTPYTENADFSFRNSNERDAHWAYTHRSIDCHAHAAVCLK